MLVVPLWSTKPDWARQQLSIFWKQKQGPRKINPFYREASYLYGQPSRSCTACAITNRFHTWHEDTVWWKTGHSVPTPEPFQQIMTSVRGGAELSVTDHAQLGDTLLSWHMSWSECSTQNLQQPSHANCLKGVIFNHFGQTALGCRSTSSCPQMTEAADPDIVSHMHITDVQALQVRLGLC